MDWRDAVVGVVGGVIVQVVGWVVGRTDSIADRRERQTKKLALEAVRESKEFVAREPQDILNEKFAADVAEVKETVKGIDSKLDRLMLSGRIPIK